MSLVRVKVIGTRLGARSGVGWFHAKARRDVVYRFGNFPKCHFAKYLYAVFLIKLVITANLEIWRLSKLPRYSTTP